MRSPLHQAARDYAQSGMPVFPCMSNSNGKFLPDGEKKQPICVGGFKAATVDLDQIDRWWSENPEANIGFHPGAIGWAVIDVEARALGVWQERDDVPETFTVRTQGGGLHYYYQGAIRDSVRKLLGKDVAVDTRSLGGYVLLPPSVINDRPYTVDHDTDVADLPGWIKARLDSRTRQVSDASPRSGIDEEYARTRGKLFLGDQVSRGRVGIKGHGSDALCYEIAANLRDLGVGVDDAADLMLAEWYPHCNPNDKPEWVRTKVYNAYKYAVSPAGIHGVGTVGDTFGDALDGYLADSLSEPVTQPKRSRFHLLDESEMDHQEPLNWLIEDLFTVNSTVMVYGKSGSYKSYMVLEWALAIASGSKTFGRAPTRTGPVVYAALEGTREIGGSRRRAYRAARQIEGSIPFYLTWAPRLMMVEEVDAFRAEIAKMETKPALIVLETVSRMMVGLDETRDAPKLIAFADSLKEQFRCTVIVVHHSGHDDGRGPRSSTVYFADPDHVIQISSPARRICQIQVTKHKNSEIPEHPLYVEGVKFLGDLVFQPVDRSRVAELTRQEDPLSPTKVAAALRLLGAGHDSAGVSDYILASELITKDPHESPEDNQKRVSDLAKRMAKRVDLRIYCTDKGCWKLPSVGIPSAA